MDCDPCNDEQLQSIADYLKESGTQKQITDLLHELLETEGEDIQNDLNSLLTTNLAAFAAACQNDAPFEPSNSNQPVISPTTVAVVFSAIAIVACLGFGAVFLFLMRRRQMLAISQHSESSEAEPSLMGADAANVGRLRRAHSAGDLKLRRPEGGDGGAYSLTDFGGGDV